MREADYAPKSDAAENGEAAARCAYISLSSDDLLMTGLASAYSLVYRDTFNAVSVWQALLVPGDLVPDARAEATCS